MKRVNFNKNKITVKMKNIFILTALFLINNIGIAQNANITISNSTTTSCTTCWVGNIFSPNTNNFTISVSEINTRIRTGSVTITTSCASCTESGTIKINNNINQQNEPNYITTPLLKFIANNSIIINATIDLGLKQAGNTERLGIPAASIEFSSTNGDIISSTNGIIKTDPLASADGGNVKFTANNGSVQINAAITTSGKNAGYIEIFGKNGVTIAANITASGGSTGILKITDNNLTSSTDLTNQGQISGTIKVASFEKLGTGIFQLKGSNIWSGNTNITGSIILGSNDAIPSTSSSLIFNGGTLVPNGFNQTINGSLKVNSNSYIDFDPNLSSNITINSIDPLPSTVYLYILDWEGFYQPSALNQNGKLSTSSPFVSVNGNLINTVTGGLNQYGQKITNVAGSGGKKGKLFITTNPSSYPDKIRFYNSTLDKYFTSKILTSGNIYEIIPNTIL